jgi:hypothetical protein
MPPGAKVFLDWPEGGEKTLSMASRLETLQNPLTFGVGWCECSARLLRYRL